MSLAIFATAVAVPLAAQDLAPAPGTPQTTVSVPAAGLNKNAQNGANGNAANAEPLNPVAAAFQRYKKDLTQQDRGAWVTELQSKMGFGTEPKEEASFWYALNAQKLDPDAWKKIGVDTLNKLATTGKTVWKTRARNAQAWLELQAATPDTARLTAFKSELTNELAKNERDAGAVETAATLALVAKRLQDTDLALKAIQQARAITDYIDYAGLYTKAELKELFDNCKQVARAAQAAAAGEPDKEPKATFDIAETHRLAGMVKRDKPDSTATNATPSKPGAIADPKAKTATEEYLQALALYAEVISKYPDHPLAAYAEVRTAECEMRMGKLDEASKRLQNFLQAAPLGPYRGQAHVLWGDLYLEYFFDGHRAEVEYNAVFKPSEYAQALKLLYRVAGKPFFAPDMTGDITLRNWANNGGIPNAAAGKEPLADEARAAADTSNQEALKTAECPKDVDSTWKEALADAHTRLGILAYMRNDLKSADRNFTTSYKEAPAEPDTALYGVLLLAERCRNRMAALPAYAARGGSDRARVALFLASCYLECRRTKESAAIYKRVVDAEIDGASTEQVGFALRRYGDCLWYSGQSKAAWSVWKQFEEPRLAATPDAPFSLLRLGCSMFTATQDMHCAEYLKAVYERYPASEAAPLAMVQYAGLLMETNPADAKSLFLRCQRLYPDCIHKSQIPLLIVKCDELSKAAEKEEAK